LGVLNVLLKQCYKTDDKQKILLSIHLTDEGLRQKKVLRTRDDAYTVMETAPYAHYSTVIIVGFSLINLVQTVLFGGILNSLERQDVLKMQIL